MIADDTQLDRWYESWLRQVAAQASQYRAQQQATAAPQQHVRTFQG